MSVKLQSLLEEVTSEIAECEAERNYLSLRLYADETRLRLRFLTSQEAIFQQMDFSHTLCCVFPGNQLNTLRTLKKHTSQFRITSVSMVRAHLK